MTLDVSARLICNAINATTEIKEHSFTYPQEERSGIVESEMTYGGEHFLRVCEFKVRREMI